jgi:hypothetical protein
MKLGIEPTPIYKYSFKKNEIKRSGSYFKLEQSVAQLFPH